MPWCEACSRFVEPSTSGLPDECPKCGRGVGPGAADPAVPWHFKLLVVATLAYLAYRAYQGLVWLLQRL